MLKAPGFWDDEFAQPLLKMDKGFIHNQGIDTLIQRVSKWKEYAGLQEKDIVEIDFGTDAPDRIFVLDAERTFNNEENKKKMVRILTYINKQIGDYQQGLSYVVSFLLLTMEENEVIAVILQMNKLLPGFWRHEAISFGTEAFTFYHILNDVYPKITSHLSTNLIDAGTFCQRWFLGLCVHCLPFRELFRFFEDFLQGGGRPYLLRFGLALFEELGDRVLATKDPETIFALLRLDTSVIVDNEVFGRILDNTGKYEERLQKYDLESLRVQVYEKHLKQRVESAHKVHAQAEIIDDCQWCLDNLPEMYCIECAKVVCEDCLNDNAPEEHLESHNVISMEEYEDRRAEFTKKPTEEDNLEKDLSKLKIN